MKKKSLTIKLKANAPDGSFTAYANTFGNVDKAGDITQKGAFLKSIAAHEKAGTMPMLLGQHEHNKNPIGVITKMYEDDVGLVIEGKFAIESSGAEAYDLVKMDAIKTFSIGYNTILEKSSPDGNLLFELDLQEVSLVTFPADTEAKLISVKSEADEEKSDEEVAKEKAFEDMTSAEKAEFFKAEAEAEQKAADDLAAEQKAAEDEAEQKAADAEAEVEAEKSAKIALELKRTSLRFNIQSAKDNSPITSQKSLVLTGSVGLAIDESLNLQVIERGRDLPTALSMIDTVQASSLDTRDIVEGNSYSDSVTGAEQANGDPIAYSVTPGLLDSYGGLVNEQTHYLISDEAMNDPAIALEPIHVKQVSVAADKKFEAEMWYGTGDTTQASQTSWHGILSSGFDAVEGLKSDSTRPFGIFQHVVYSIAGNNLTDTLSTIIESINGDADANSSFFMNKATFTNIRALNKTESTAAGFDLNEIKRVDGQWHIQGYPVVFSESFKAFNSGVDDFLCVFGDIEAAYKQYVHPTITVKNEFSVDGATKMLSRQRRSGLVKDSNALKVILMAA